MLLVVTGGRDHPPFRPLYEKKYLADICQAMLAYNPVTGLYHGGARGADTAAALWAARAGLKVTVFPAQWKKYGNGAGHIRNRQMWDAAVATGDIVLLVAFPGGAGTKNMLATVEEYGGNIALYGGAVPAYDDLVPF